MTEVFLDTVGLIAVWDTADQWHSAADGVFRVLLAQGRRLVTTELVLVECGNAAARRPYRRQVSELRRALRDEGMMIKPTAEEIEEAWDAYHRGEAGHAGIVDHVSFIVMRRLELTEVFSNDRHFEAAGFTRLF
jgi:uncharacterized protein